MYDNGQGVEQSYEKAFHYYKLDADQGDRDAQFLVGRYYHEGPFVEKSREKAYKWFKLAAAQDYDIAKEKLNAEFKDFQDLET